MFNKIKLACSTIIYIFDTFDRFIYDQKLLVYGNWKQKAISQAIISTIGTFIGLVLGAIIVINLF